VAEPAGASWLVLLTWSVVVTQVVAVVLFIAGGVRLAAGAGRGALTTGAALCPLATPGRERFDAKTPLPLL